MDLSTVVGEFTGVSRVIDHKRLVRAHKQLWKVSGVKYMGSSAYKLKFPRIRFLELRSASPNGKVSIDSVIWDAFAFYHNPTYLIRLTIWYVTFRGYWYILSLWVILALG